LAEAIKRLHPTADLATDIQIRDDATGARIVVWNEAKFGPRPAEADVLAAANELKPWTCLTLDQHRAAKVAALESAFQQVGYEHYPQHRQTQLIALMVEAMGAGLAARAAYIGTALEWMKLLTGYYFTLAKAVADATTHEAVDGVQPDWAAFLAANADPLVTVEHAAGLDS
jgi:hypothetical protein